MSFYRQALEINPEHIEAYANLVHTQAFLCDWERRAESFARLQELVAIQLQRPPSAQLCSVQPFHTLGYPLSMEEMHQIAAQYAEKAKSAVTLVDALFTQRSKSSQARLKVGYVSSDFGNHPLSQLMQNVFGMHDRSR